MNKTVLRCPKCGGYMDTKRSDAKQCRKCRRKQGDIASHKNKKKNRLNKTLESNLEKAKSIGVQEEIEKNLLNTLEKCLEDSKKMPKKDFESLKEHTCYDFEVEDLLKNTQDDKLRELRETKFKSLFD